MDPKPGLIKKTIIATFSPAIFIIKVIQKSKNSNAIIYRYANDTLWEGFP